MRMPFLFLFLFLSACSSRVVSAEQVVPTSTSALFATATLVPTVTSRPSLTAAPPTIAPTISPILALLTAQVNVRAAPDKSASVLGLLNYGTRVQVIGKDLGSEWWQIIYPENSTTTGWVALTYVQIAEADARKIPVVQANSPTVTQLPAVSAGTPEPVVHSAKLKAQINVRSGPGQAFESKGLLNAGTIVILTGRSQNNVWVQIKFDGGVDGKGWVAAAYLEAADLAGLPYFDNQGAPVAAEAGAPNPPAGTGGQPTSSPTAFSAAAPDGDSEKNPAAKIKFSPDSVREFIYSSDLSSPNGDPTDWVAFSAYEPTNQSTFVYFKLKCSGNGGITATLEQDGLPVAGARTIVCGNYDVAIKVLGGKEYILVLNADGSGGQLRYVSYTLTVTSLP